MPSNATTELYDEILEGILSGSAKTLRHLLQPLSSDQRAALYRRLRPLLAVLRQVCNLAKDAPAVNVVQLAAKVRPEPQDFARRKPSLLVDDGPLFHRIQTVHVGLASRRHMITGLQRRELDPGDWRDKVFVHAVGSALLDRPEP